jgi:hypothetical protein
VFAHESPITPTKVSRIVVTDAGDVGTLCIDWDSDPAFLAGIYLAATGPFHCVCYGPTSPPVGSTQGSASGSTGNRTRIGS